MYEGGALLISATHCLVSPRVCLRKSEVTWKEGGRGYTGRQLHKDTQIKIEAQAQAQAQGDRQGK